MSASTLDRRSHTATQPTVHSATRHPAKRDARSLNRLRGLTLTITLLLIPQYALGMLINLFIAFPSALPGGNAWHWAMSQTTLIPAHVYLGTLLIVLAIVTLGFAIAARRRTAIIAAALGLALLVGAWISGETFLTYGQNNVASLWMSFGFLGAFVTYAIGYALLRRARA